MEAELASVKKELSDAAQLSSEAVSKLEHDLSESYAAVESLKRSEVEWKERELHTAQRGEERIAALQTELDSTKATSEDQVVALQAQLDVAKNETVDHASQASALREELDASRRSGSDEVAALQSELEKARSQA